jgi:hypothetical protein
MFFARESVIEDADFVWPRSIFLDQEIALKLADPSTGFVI